MYDPNSDEVKLGEWAQRKADEILMRDGWHVLAMHKAGDGKAALFKGQEGSIIAMDNLDILGGRTVLRDVKGKTQSTFYRREQGEQHGIDERVYQAYKQQCEKSGMDGYIAVVELNREIATQKIIPSKKLLIYSLNVPTRFCSRQAMRVPYGKGGMRYWNRDEYLEEFDL